MRKLLTLSLMFTVLAVMSQRTKRNSSSNYEAQTVIVKVKDEFRADCMEDNILNSRLEYIFNKVGVNSLKKEFPGHEKPSGRKLANGHERTDISLIYRLKYNSKDDPWTVIPHLQKTGMFEYVEPSFKFEFLYTPDDPQISDLYFLDTLKAYQAWDVTQGDTNVVIGISDTGFDIDHPDLVDNVKYNYADPINSIDDDGDGFVDNFRGWDIGENDNDPTVGASWHGIFVSGIAGATTDNNNQLAGVGFKCKLMPIKITDAGGDLVGGYNSIVYAADRGCDVINCSWGGVNSWSQQGQDIVKYATVDKNCLVIASAGNSHQVDKFYPASFDWAVSVGGTDTLNQKWVQSGTEGSNYNDYIDVMAPAVAVMRINNNGGTLGGGRGTSFSSPMVAGAAGIIKSQFPSYSAIQVMEQLKATCDSLEPVPFNAPYAGKMGEGLVNMYKAVTETSHPGFYMDGMVYNDLQDGLFTDGETIYVYGTLFNALATSSAGSKMTISTESPYVEWIDSVRVFGSVPAGASGSTSGIPFSFKVKAGTPPSTEVEFKIVFEDGDYNTKQMVSTTLNVDYLSMNVNDIGFTVGASGKLGYNVNGAQSQGLGVKVSGGNSILYQMGLLAAVDGTKSSFMQDGDWETHSELSYTYPGVEADLDVLTVFDDDAAGVNSIGLKLKQKTLVWDDSDKRKFIIVEYNVINTSGAPISGLNLGIFADWDITNYANNNAIYDSTINTGYCYEPGGLYGGVHILSDSSFQHYAFNNDGSNSSINQYDGFSSSEQFTSISGGDARNSAGLTDVSQVVGVGGVDIPTGDSVTLAFAIVAGANYTELKDQALKSGTVYKSIRVIDLIESHNLSALCFDSCNAEVGVVASSGIPPYSYAWNDPLTQSTDTAIGLCEGNYICTVTDAIGNFNTIPVSITEPSKLTINFTDTVMDLSPGCTGEINGVISGGTPTYTIDWEDDAGRDTMHAVDLCFGDYHLKVTDANGCEVLDTMEISLITNLNELKPLINLELFPNPASNEIRFKGESLDGNTTVMIIDTQGKLIKTEKVVNLNLFRFDVSELSKGSYVVKAIHAGATKEFNVILR